MLPRNDLQDRQTRERIAPLPGTLQSHQRWNVNLYRTTRLNRSLGLGLPADQPHHLVQKPMMTVGTRSTASNVIALAAYERV